MFFLSEDDSNSVRGNINYLAIYQERVSYVVKDNLTILNTTRVDVAENRQAINDLIGALSVLSALSVLNTANVKCKMHHINSIRK